jgi:polar amino acid transport system substrate-binding protein
MRSSSAKDCRPARISGPAFFLLAALLAAACLSAPGARAAALSDHRAGLAALADLKAAINEIVAASADNSTDRRVYYRAGARAINALEGEAGDEYAAAAGNPGDRLGAIGHIDRLLDREATPPWAVPLRGAEANMRAAVAHLLDADRARGLDGFNLAASRALAYLEVARGRPTESGLFGGLEGALANTVLGVPAGAHQQDACETPSAAPTYGTHGGYLAWVTLPTSDGTHVLAEDPGGTELSIQHGMIVLHTAEAKPVAEACGQHAEATPIAIPAAASPEPASAQPPQLQKVVQHAAQTTPQQPAPAAPAAGPPPALYTKAQAAAGRQIFATKCVVCHGANLQGTAAPSVAGNDFLTTAQHNGWTLAIIRYIVFKLMPLNSPSSLSPTDDAKLMAFLLASNCYPAGTTPFPSDDESKFASVKLGPIQKKPDGQNAAGVCKVD